MVIPFLLSLPPSFHLFSPTIRPLCFFIQIWWTSLKSEKQFQSPLQSNRRHLWHGLFFQNQRPGGPEGPLLISHIFISCWIKLSEKLCSFPSLSWNCFHDSPFFHALIFFLALWTLRCMYGEHFFFSKLVYGNLWIYFRDIFPTIWCILIISTDLVMELAQIWAVWVRTCRQSLPCKGTSENQFFMLLMVGRLSIIPLLGTCGGGGGGIELNFIDLVVSRSMPIDKT